MEFFPSICFGAHFSVSADEISFQKTNKVRRQLLAITKRFGIHATRTTHPPPNRPLSTPGAAKVPLPGLTLYISLVLFNSFSTLYAWPNCRIRIRMGMRMRIRLWISCQPATSPAPYPLEVRNVGLFDIYKFSGRGARGRIVRKMKNDNTAESRVEVK